MEIRVSEKSLIVSFSLRCVFKEVKMESYLMTLFEVENEISVLQIQEEEKAFI